MTALSPGITGEAAGLLAALYCGIVIGVVYDIFAVIRLPFKNLIIVSIIDLLFYIAALIISAATMLFINCGGLRLYIFLAAGLGIYLYKRYTGRLIRYIVGSAKKKFTKYS